MANLDTCASTMCVPQRVRVGATFIACPGSGHSQADRSSGVRLAPGSPDVFFIFSPAGDPFGECGITFVRGSGLRLASTPCANGAPVFMVNASQKRPSRCRPPSKNGDILSVGFTCGIDDWQSRENRLTLNM